MSKLDEIIDPVFESMEDDVPWARWADQTKSDIKKLILDLFKEADYDGFEFVDKVSKL